MTQEEKDLLLKDLSARLTYGVYFIGYKVVFGGTDITIFDKEKMMGIVEDTLISQSGSFNIEKVKPYLRPMSSMTDEEKKEYRNFIEFSYNDYTSESKECVYVTNVNSFVDWLDKNMFDHRGLIPLGLAIDVTKVNNNPYKN